jgi:hypothetical protein
MKIMRVCIADSLFDGEGNGGATHQAAAGSRYRDGVGLLRLREVTSLLRNPRCCPKSRRIAITIGRVATDTLISSQPSEGQQ